MSLLIIAIVAGVLTVLAPCILPLLPVVIGASDSEGRGLSRRSVVVIGSLAVSIIVFTLLLKASTLLITIPSAVWTWFSGTVLLVLGLTLIFPTWWGRLPGVARLSRSSNRVVGQGYQQNSVAGDILMGVALGPVFSTCSPTYLYIIATVLPATFWVGLGYLVGFVAGLSAALLAIAYFGQQFVNRLLRKFATASRIKQLLGLLLVIVGISIMTGLDKKLETKILDSGYGATIKLEEGWLDQLRSSDSESAAEPAPSDLSVRETDAVGDGVHATAMFANGCFWCVEHDLEAVRGVMAVVSGYAGGATTNPTYDTYAAGGHREVVEVTYDPTILTYGNLVEHIIKHGNPTDAEGSFYDRGPSYSPAIYVANAKEAQDAASVIEHINKRGVYTQPLAIPILPVTTFYPAENYHQDYAKKNPLKYSYFRAGSGRTKFIEQVWGDELDQFTFSPAVGTPANIPGIIKQPPYINFQKPDDAALRAQLSDIAYTVTQKAGTERAGTSPLDTNYEPGIYVDVVSGEPLFSSRDKYDSGTGWPSFVQPIQSDVVKLHEDKKLWSTRTEVRSRIADSHLGHVFPDGPVEQGGQRYCMNGAALRFVPLAAMEGEGYGEWISKVQ